MKLDKDSIDAWFESEEGKASIERFANKLKLEKKRKKFYVKKLKKYFDRLSDEGVNAWIENFVKWEKEYQERYYKKCIETHSNILSTLWEFFKIHGNDTDLEEDFQTSCYQYRGFEMSIFHGQGSFLKLYKIEKKRLL